MKLNYYLQIKGVSKQHHIKNIDKDQLQRSYKYKIKLKKKKKTSYQLIILRVWYKQIKKLIINKINNYN